MVHIFINYANKKNNLPHFLTINFSETNELFYASEATYFFTCYYTKKISANPILNFDSMPH